MTRYNDGVGLKYSIRVEGNVVIVDVSGVPDRQAVIELWRDVVSASREHSCFNVLGLASTERPMGLGDALEIEALFSAAGVTNEFRIAWLNPNPAARPIIDLVEELMRNRDMADARFFDNEMQARAWLSGAT